MRCQVFHGMQHLTAKREGYKRTFGQVRTPKQIKEDRIAARVLQQIHNRSTWAR